MNFAIVITAMMGCALLLQGCGGGGDPTPAATTPMPTPTAKPACDEEDLRACEKQYADDKKKTNPAGDALCKLAEAYVACTAKDLPGCTPAQISAEVKKSAELQEADCVSKDAKAAADKAAEEKAVADKAAADKAAADEAAAAAKAASDKDAADKAAADAAEMKAASDKAAADAAADKVGADKAAADKAAADAAEVKAASDKAAADAATAKATADAAAAKLVSDKAAADAAAAKEAADQVGCPAIISCGTGPDAATMGNNQLVCGALETYTGCLTTALASCGDPSAYTAGAVLKESTMKAIATQCVDKWKCSVCGNVYEPTAQSGGMDHVSDKNVAFEELPESWKCPRCGQPKSAYKKVDNTQTLSMLVHDHHAEEKAAEVVAV